MLAVKKSTSPTSSRKTTTSSSLKSLFSVTKQRGYVIPVLDRYLYKLSAEDENRAIDVNAPSSAGGCLRARYYSRTQAPKDGGVEPRTRRIFDNGTGFHERIQGYLMEAGLLLMAEVPVRNDEHNIQGHTDGILGLSPAEKAILELKSINSKGFEALKEAKPEHKLQGCEYLYCIEERRQELHDTYANEAAFKKDKSRRMKYYASLYQHIKGGRKHTREEKIAFQCDLHDKLDTILMSTRMAITKVVFVYENKDTQDLKEYVVTLRDQGARANLQQELEDCKTLNTHVRKKVIPARPVKSPSDNMCRFCDYKRECWN